jgi:hypothetical protein
MMGRKDSVTTGRPDGLSAVAGELFPWIGFAPRVHKDGEVGVVGERGVEPWFRRRSAPARYWSCADAPPVREQSYKWRESELRSILNPAAPRKRYVSAINVKCLLFLFGLATYILSNRSGFAGILAACCATGGEL